MSRLTGKISRRIMALVLSLAMIMPNMTAYAGELNMPQAEVQADIDTDTDDVIVDMTEDAGNTSDVSEDDAASDDDGVTDDAAGESGENDAVSDETGDDNAEPDGTEEGDVNNSDDADAEDENSDLDEEESNDSEEEFEAEAEKPLKDASSGQQTEVVEHIMNETTLATHLVESPGAQITPGTLLADYFTTVDNVMQCWDDNKNGDYLRLQSKSRGAVKFTVTGSAKLEIEAGCVNDNASTYIVLADPAGDEYKKLDKTSCTATTFPNDENQDTVTDRAKQKRTWSNLEAGTYVICTNGLDSTPRGKDLRIYSIKVTETVVARGDWEDVQSPTITAEKDATDNGKINVTVTADVSDNGGDKVEVEMYKGSTADGTPQETKTSRDKANTHNLSFYPTESGIYCFKAKLSRTGAVDKESDVTEPIALTVPLSTPNNLAVTEQISGDALVSVTFSWNEVKEADHYKVVVTDNSAGAEAEPFYQKDNISKNTKSIVITSQEANLGRGKTYKFILTAVRPNTGTDGANEEVTASISKKISSGVTETRTYVFNPSIMEDIDYMEKGPNGGVADGTVLGTDAYFSIGLYKSNGYVENSGQFVRVRQGAQAGIEFTVEGTAKVEAGAASTGANNASTVALQKINKDKNGKVTVEKTLTEKNDKTSVTGDKNPNSLVWENLEAGTYNLVTPEISGVTNRDLRVYSLKVTETSDRGERTGFDLVSRPEVTSVTNNDGKLSVSVSNALVGYDGGDRLVVMLEDSNGQEVSGVRGVSALPGSSHTVTMDLALCETGNYTVKAKLIRGVGSDKEELVGSVTKPLAYRQKLEDPTSLYAENMGKTESGRGSVKLSWGLASGAHYYVIKVVSGSGEETRLETPDNSNSYIIDSGLTIGQKYTFKVYAANKLNDTEALSQNAAVVENYEITEGAGDPPYVKGTYTLKISSDITKFNESTKKDGEMERVGTEKFFTMIYNSSSKVESVKQKFPDNSEESGRLSFNSSARTVGGSIKFATSGPARVTVYWQAAGDGREMKIIDGEDKELKSTNIGTTQNEAYISRFYLEDAGTYYLGSKGGNNYIYKVIVDNQYTTNKRPEWNTVPDPEILEVKQVNGDLLVKVKAKIGSEGTSGEADKVEVTMYDEKNVASGRAKTVLEGAADPVLTITPASSGKYRFKAELSRAEEDSVKSSEYPAQEDPFFEYVLPLEVPVLEAANVKNKGAVDEAKQHGSVELSWGSVKEADRYSVKVKGKDTEYEREYSTDVPAILIDEDLAVGKTYEFSVCAQRDATGEFDSDGKPIKPETTKASASRSMKIEADYKSKWNFVVYGIGTSQKASGFVTKDGTASTDKTDAAGKAIYSSGYTVKKPDGVNPNPEYGVNGVVTPKPEDLKDNEFLRMWTWDGKGKIVPGDTDGLAFYYTEVNPKVNNFKLSANLHVNAWRIGNGQEGFGLLAADWIGKDGDTAYHWTNSYTAVASKVDYKWDSVNDRVSTTDGTSVTLRIGIGSTAKTGVTAENLSVFENDVTTATTQYYQTETLPLDTSVHTNLYDNLIGNETLGATKLAPNPVVDLKLSIELDATGYYVTYTPLTKNTDGTFTEGKQERIRYYDRDALSMVEENTAYVGFFVTRYADVTFSDYKFETSRYDSEAPTEAMPTEEVTLKTSVSTSATANNEDYNLTYSANWKGTVTVMDEAGALLAQETIAPRDGDLTEEGKLAVPVKLHIGTNKFQVTYTPDKDYEPYGGKPHAILTSYEPKVNNVTVTWKKYGKEGDILYVSPKGKATGDGTKVNPLDVYTAVKYAQPGQTIYLIGGTYNLTQTIKIDRGVNGTKDNMIYMLADPETCKDGVRPVFDFNSQCPAMVIAGDWWYYQGFDVTRSGNQMKGLQVSGNHNTLDGLNIYKNGSTGLQISRLLSSDKFEDWPSYNLILNCTSVLNADAGYTDADGFAAKLTVGNGNVFDGCVSAYNADDGWDLFAKVWTGPIGIVTIRNSVSFENGQVIRDKKTHELVWFDESDNWEIVGGSNPDNESSEFEEDEDGETWEIIDAGSGNGYKMGGSSITGYHRLENSVAFHNKSKGIDSNSCNDIQAFNSISYDNASYNIAMYSNASKTDFAATGVISYRKSVGMDNEDRIGVKDKSTVSSIVTTQEDCVEKIFNNTNFFWNKLIHKSEPGSEYYRHYTTCTDESTGQTYKPSISVSDDWFKNLDYDWWNNNYCKNTSISGLGRSEDGTGRIDLHGFLELSDAGKEQMAKAGVKDGAGLGTGTESKDADDFKDKVNGETSGSVNNGGDKGNTDKTEDGIAADDFAQMPGNAEEVGLWIAIVDRDKIEYTGKALKPEIRVYSGNKRLKKGKDYTVTYKNNLNAYVGAYDDTYYDKYSEVYTKYTGVEFAALKGTYSSVDNKKKPTIIIKAKGNYKNYDTKNVTQIYFDINPVSLTNDAMNRIGMSDMALVAKSGSQQNVKPVVTFNNKKLSSANDKDYSFKIYSTDSEGNSSETAISGSKVSTAGLYKVEITGKNNFAGIAAIDLNVVGDDKNALASNFKLKTKIPDKYREGYNAVSVDEEIPLPVELSETELVVVDKNGKTLTKDSDYKLSYKNNIDVGTATVIVTGISSKDETGKLTGYVGSKEFKFRIVAPTLNTMLKKGDAKLIDTTDITGDEYEKVNGMLKIKSNSLTNFGDNHTYQYEGRAVDPVNDELVDSSGSHSKLGLAVKRGNDWYLLSQGKDYKLSYKNNTRKGNAAAVFTGIGNYRGSVTQKFKITEFDLDKMENRLPQNGEDVSRIGGTFEIRRSSKSGDDTFTGAVFKDGYNTSTKTYSGLEVTYKKGSVKPTVSLTINGNLLKAGQDYTVTYKNNTKPTENNTPASKMPTIIIRGRNGIKGTLTGTFKISKKDLDDKVDVIKVTAQDVKISKSTSAGYTGSYKSRIVVKDAQGKTLSEGTDYDRNIKYELVDNATRKTVIKELNDRDLVTINKDDENQYLTVKATVYPKKDSKYYTGSSEGISTYYRILYTKNSIRRSTFVVNYGAVENDDTCLYEATADKKAFYYYEDGINLNGSLLTVKLDGKTLVWGEDYEVVKYVGNNKQGTAKLTIQGKGKYFDTKVITFKIMPKDFKWWQKPIL